MLSSWCGKTQTARIEANWVAIVAEWNSGGRPAMKYYVECQKFTYVEYCYTSVHILYNTPAVIGAYYYDALILG